MPVDTRQHLARRIGRFIVRAAPKSVRGGSADDQKALIEMAAEGVLQLWALMEGGAKPSEPEEADSEEPAPKAKGRKTSSKRGET